MATQTLTIGFDGSVLKAQIAALKPRFSALPKRARKAAFDEFERLLSRKRFLKVEQLRNVATSHAGDVIFRPRILRGDELFATALRAAKRKGFGLHSRAPVCAKGRRKPKASTGSPASLRASEVRSTR